MKRYINILFQALLLCSLSNASFGDTTEANASREKETFDYAEFRFELVNHIVVDLYATWAPDLDWNTIRPLYAEQKLKPFWFDEHGINQRAEILKLALEKAGQEGLDPNEYHVEGIARLWDAKKISNLAKLEILLTDALIRYSAEVQSGYPHPRAVDPDWHIQPTKMDRRQLVSSVLAAKQFDKSLENLPPQNRAYQQLKAALERYRKFAAEGEWARVSGWQTLKLGSQHENVAQIRERLTREGFVLSNPEGNPPILFDRELERAMMQYQVRNGLKPDGIVGRATRYSLNVPISHRIRQIIQNMERWRWLPRSLGKRYIMVNMAGYKLYYVVKDRVDLEMRVIVGLPYRATPVFRDEMEYIELNPTWAVPQRIAVEDLLPKVRNNKGFLKVNQFKVYENWNENANEIDPNAIDWNQVSDSDMNYKFEQSPGHRNSLGKVKFMFPNRFSVYLHDTPIRSLFNESERTFSSGCIRVARPVSLAERVLGRDQGWTPRDIRRMLNTDTTLRVDLRKSVPVYLLYWTAWVEEDGEMHFRRDIYRRNTNIVANISGSISAEPSN